MAQIMEPENPPQETGETALEVGGNPGPSSSLEIWGEQDSRVRTSPQRQGPYGQGLGRREKTSFYWQMGGRQRPPLSTLVDSWAGAGGHRGLGEG